MGSNLIETLERASHYVEYGKKISDTLRAENLTPAQKQKLKLQLKEFNSKIRSLHKNLMNKITSTIVTVEFTFNGKRCKGQFVNWTDNEINTYYGMVAKMRNAEIVIKKISRIQTKVSDKPL